MSTTSSAASMSAPGSWCCRRTRREGRGGPCPRYGFIRRRAGVVMTFAVGPAGDELLEARRCSDEGTVAEAEHGQRIRRRLALGAPSHCVCRGGAGGASRGFLSRCSARSASARRKRRRRRCRSPMKAKPRKILRAKRLSSSWSIPAARPIASAPATGAISRSRQPQSKPGRLVQQFLPGQRNQSGLRRRHRHAAMENGKPYSELPNAFRYRNEIVAVAPATEGPDRAGAGHDRKRPDARKGDIVAGANGLMVAGHGADKRGASLNYTPVSEKR